MSGVDKLQVLLPLWIEHDGERAREFRRWADGVGRAEEKILAAANLMNAANIRLEDTLERVSKEAGKGQL